MQPRRFFLLALDPDAEAPSLAAASGHSVEIPRSPSSDRPRIDHVELIRRLGAERLSFAELRAAPRLYRSLARVLGRAAALGWWAASRVRTGDSVVSSGEDVGLWFELAVRLRRRPVAHTLVVHHLGTLPKRIGSLLARPRPRRVVAYCPAQADWARRMLGCSPHQVLLLPFQVDAEFFARAVVPEQAASRRSMPPTVAAVGREARDFDTLFAAVEGLAVRVVISAYSPWRPAPGPASFPANVEQRRLSYAELRALYAESLVVVVPVEDVDYAAGLNAIVEGLAAGRAVIATRHRGRPHWLRHERNCLLYEAGDTQDLRRCLRRLIEDPQLARTLGRAGRRLVERGIDQTRYTDRLRRVVERAERGDRGVPVGRGDLSCPS